MGRACAGDVSEAQLYIYELLATFFFERGTPLYCLSQVVEFLESLD